MILHAMSIPITQMLSLTEVKNMLELVFDLPVRVKTDKLSRSPTPIPPSGLGPFRYRKNRRASSVVDIRIGEQRNCAPQVESDAGLLLLYEGE